MIKRYFLYIIFIFLLYIYIGMICYYEGNNIVNFAYIYRFYVFLEFFVPK